MALLSTLSDLFNGPLDPLKWGFSPDQVTVGDGTPEGRLLVSDGGFAATFITSHNLYEFDTASLKIDSVPGEAGRYVYLGISAVSDTESYTPHFEMSLYGDNLIVNWTNFPSNFVGDGFLVVPYNETYHAWWKITKVGSLIVWWVSPNGTSWNELTRYDPGYEDPIVSTVYQVTLVAYYGVTYLSHFNDLTGASLVWAKQPDGTWANVGTASRPLQIKFPDGTWVTNPTTSVKQPDGAWKVVVS
jgi:hypothetical protein